ncbi:MAG: glucosaminidase domain-containing protein [Acidobacteria bacterium]|nr:glucosaminidase domain-containing protein [Acidobacteriota bacterium]MBI3487467.1 glucosaminidase domain-containing protein [Acidobacteriota bacterium]
MTHADQMWVIVYSDTDSSVPHPGVVYDDLLVTGSIQGVVLQDGFEGSWPYTATISSDPGGWTTWLAGVFQETLGQEDPGLWRREVIYLGSLAIAEVDANGMHELHSDHLGSPRLVTRGNGAWDGGLIGTVEATQAYGPYGELISQTGSYVPLMGYTGHIQTDASGLIYMRGRYYSPAWHAFVNSDQGVDPNTWNQRAYVGGSPFMATDPSGNVLFMTGFWEWLFGLGGGGSMPGTTVEVVDNMPKDTPTTVISWWPGGFPDPVTPISTVGEGRGRGGTVAPQAPKTKGPCPPNVKAFLNNPQVQQTLQSVATALNTNVNFVGAQASMESGWLNAHNAGLNNLFGLTRGGGRNIAFGSLADSGTAYVNAAAVNGINPTKVYGATTIQQFANQLQSPDPYRYNSVDANGYSNKLINQYNYYMKMVDNCQPAQ